MSEPTRASLERAREWLLQSAVGGGAEARTYDMVPHHYETPRGTRVAHTFARGGLTPEGEEDAVSLAREFDAARGWCRECRDSLDSESLCSQCQANYGEQCAAEERARIVADLRAAADDNTYETAVAKAIAAAVLRSAADRYERGEHFTASPASPAAESATPPSRDGEGP